MFHFLPDEGSSALQGSAVQGSALQGSALQGSVVDASCKCLMRDLVMIFSELEN